MRDYLRRILFVLGLLVIGVSCQQDTSNVEGFLLKAEDFLTELQEALKQEKESENDTSSEIKERTDVNSKAEKREQSEKNAFPEAKELDSITSYKHLSLVSWNIQHLGKSKTDDEIWEMAQILRHYDMVAIQEVVAKDPAGAQAVARLADALNRMGFKWDYQVSNPTKSPSVYISERYAFLWKTSRVAIQNRAFLDSEREDSFYREPYIAAFKPKGVNKTFYVANYHSRVHSSKPEEEIIHLLDYSERWNTPYFLIVGDFNTSETNPVWKPFYKKGYKSALNGVRTTLKRACKDGTYVNHPIDNIYYTSQVQKHQANSIDFVGSCDNLQHARGISDHLPVFIEFSLE